MRAQARAIGEIGLDYHYDFAPRDVQQTVFREQIGLARRLRLPIVIHTREAADDTFRILAEESAGEVGGVFHCFTGDAVPWPDGRSRQGFTSRFGRHRDVSARGGTA